MSSRNQYSSRFKAQVALEAIKNQRTIGEIASEYGIHPSQIHKWKKHVLCFGYRVARMKLQGELYQQIGKLKVELDWLKKKLVCSVDQKRSLVELPHPEIPIYRQCELLGLPRSSFYYKPAGISEYNLLLMDMIDKKYIEHPFYGILRMTA